MVPARSDVNYNYQAENFGNSSNIKDVSFHLRKKSGKYINISDSVSNEATGGNLFVTGLMKRKKTEFLEIMLLDEKGRFITSVTTNSDGAFAAEIPKGKTITVQAEDHGQVILDLGRFEIRDGVINLGDVILSNP